jgi:uncharacterized cupredoxin-like copper-binding protein
MTPSSSTPLQRVRVTEKEFSITPSAIDLSRPGTYSFTVTNDGQITHAFEIQGNGVDERTPDLQPGRSATLTVDLAQKGSYDAFCPIDAHRSKGMLAKLTVGAGA